MVEITLEKIDIVRERTGVSYAKAKEALEASEGNVVDAIIYIEENKKSAMDSIYTTKDEFLAWIKDIIKKGNITRIKVKKDGKILVDVPVNAGIAVGIVAYAVWAPLIAIGVIGAVVTNLTIELTKEDGSVEIINKIIKSTVEDVKEKVNDLASDVKDKFNNKRNEDSKDETVYTYTVKFNEDKDI